VSIEVCKSVRSSCPCPSVGGSRGLQWSVESIGTRQFLHTNYSTLSFNCIATTTSILKKKNTHFKASILNYILKGLGNISHQNEIIFVLLLVVIKIMIFDLYIIWRVRGICRVLELHFTSTMIARKYWGKAVSIPKKVKFRANFLHHRKLKFLASTIVLFQISYSSTYLKLNLVCLQFLGW